VPVLSQGEANALLAMPKQLAGQGRIEVVPGTRAKYDVESHDGSEKFVLHVTRNSIKLQKVTSHFRQRTVGLARLCVEGAPHTNPGPDGQHFGGTHLHIYVEGFDDKIAHPLPADFTDVTDIPLTVTQFCTWLHITNAHIQGSMATGGGTR
jgi:Family of unknown function (DUF6978)